MTSSFWSRFERRRVTRRRVLSAAAASTAALSLLPLVGCDDSSDPDEAEPRSGGTLRYGTTVPFSYGFDPHLEQGGGLPVIARTYGYPFHVDPRDDTLILDHAQSVEQPEPGVYVITLASRRFHPAAPGNGRAVTAEDVVLSMRRYRDHPLVTSRFWHTKLLGEHGASGQTILLRTTRPYAYTLHEMGHINAGAILPRETVETQADARAGVSGSGPMMIGAGSTATLARLAGFEGYEPRSLVDAMEWRVFDDEKEKAAAFRAGELDVLSATDRREATALGDEDLTIVTEPALSWTSVGIRVDQPPFADERTRRAFDLAIDRDALLRAAGAVDGAIVGPVNGRLAGGFWSLTRDEIGAAQGAELPIEERIAEARTLLQAAGTIDTSIELQVAASPELLDLAALLREQMRPAGIDLRIAQLALPGWFFSFRGGNFQSTLISHAPYETPDAPLRLYHSQGPEGTGSPFGFSSGAIDWLIERSWAEEDRGQRRATLLEAQRLMIEARPMVHLFSGAAYSVVRDHVRDSGLELPGSLARYHYRQWLDVDAEEAAD